MMFLFRRWLMSGISVASLAFSPVFQRAVAAEAPASGQPSNQIGLVYDRDPVAYGGYVLSFDEGGLVGHDRSRSSRVRKVSSSMPSGPRPTLSTLTPTTNSPGLPAEMPSRSSSRTR